MKRTTRGNRKRFLGALLVSILVCPTAAFALTLSVTDDADINLHSQNQKNGGKRQCLVRNVGGGGERHCLVKFDLSPTSPDGTIEQATLWMSVTKVQDEGYFDVHVLNGAWTQASVTAGSAPAYNPTSIGSVLITHADAGGDVSLGVASTVQAWVDGTLANHGLIFVPSSGDGLRVELASKESRTSTPMEIEVEERVVDPTGRHYNVLTFGAAGDGVTDDTIAIQAAIDTAGGQGGATVFFPNGRYKITNTLRLNRSHGLNMRLQGEGSSELEFANLGAGVSGIEITTDTAEVLDLILQGPSPAGDYIHNQHAIHAYGVSLGDPLTDLRIERCEITGFGSSGLRAKFANKVVVSHTRFRYLGHSGAFFMSSNIGEFTHNEVAIIGGKGSPANVYGVSLSHDSSGNLAANPSSDSWLIADNVIKGIPTWTCIDGHAASNVRVIGNHMVSCRNPIDISSSSGSASHITGFNLVIKGNIIEGGFKPNATVSAGINVGGTPTMQQNNVVITGNIVEGQGVAGNSNSGAIKAASVTTLVISNNTISNWGGSAINLTGTMHGASVTNNVISDGISNAATEAVIWDTSSSNSTRTYLGNRSRPTAIVPCNGLEVTRTPELPAGDVMKGANSFYTCDRHGCSCS